MEFEVDFELGVDGRWIAEAIDLRGILVYGSTQEEAKLSALALAQQVVSEIALRTH
jgi:hypothetical protein